MSNLMREGKSLDFLVRNGITEADFVGEQEARVYRVVHDFVSRTGSGVMPSIAWVYQESGVDLENVPEAPSEFYLDVVRRRSQQRAIQAGIEETDQLLERFQVSEARDSILRLAGQLVLSNGNGTIRLDDAQVADQVMALHDQRLQNPESLAGVPFGLPYLDYVSDGAQPGDLITLVGRTGLGKTYLLLTMAIRAWMAGHRVLFLSMEMTKLSIMERFLAICAGISTTPIHRGLLSGFSRKRLEDVVEEFKSRNTEVPFNIEYGGEFNTIEKAKLLVLSTRPDVVYIDSAYILKAGNLSREARDWEQVSSSTIAQKDMAVSLGIPVIASHQYNRKGHRGGVDNIGRSDEIGRLSSLVLSLYDEDAEDDHPGKKASSTLMFSPVKYKLLEIEKNRWESGGLIRLVWDMKHASVSQDSYWSGKEWRKEVSAREAWFMRTGD